MRNKNLTDSVIRWVLNKLNLWNLHRIKNKKSIINNPKDYEVLLPNVNSDNFEHYAESLKIALNTHDVNNIAITGPYGSGKSSFIQSFKEKNAEWSYLTISLATFKNTKDKETKTIPDDKQETNENSELYQDIERSILQQLFYKEKTKKLQFSRFRRIKIPSKIESILLSIGAIYLSLYFFLHLQTKQA